MPKIKSLLACMMIFSLASCSESLSDTEMSIIENKISEQIYKENLTLVSGELYEYFCAGIDKYADQVYDEITKKENEDQAISALFGVNIFDPAEFIGSSSSEIMANRYNNYIVYVNSHNLDLQRLIEDIAEVMKTCPELQAEFSRSHKNGEGMSLTAFSQISGIPSELNSDFVADYISLGFTEQEQIIWGESVMGNYKKPELSEEVVIMAMLKALEGICVKPYPVYAVYDDDEFVWEVGYNTEDAVIISFEEKGDVVRYDYALARFEDVLIDSETNVLRQK